VHKNTHYGREKHVVTSCALFSFTVTIWCEEIGCFPLKIVLLHLMTSSFRISNQNLLLIMQFLSFGVSVKYIHSVKKTDNYFIFSELQTFSFETRRLAVHYIYIYSHPVLS
jgi:hypothetical protein